MDTEAQKLIEGLGFSDNEARVYLACLESDNGSNTLIAKRSELNRVTNYEILKRLMERGVVAEVGGTKVKRFSAVEPKTLVRISKEKVLAAEEALPALTALTDKERSRPRISFYEGIEGIKSIYEDSLNAKTELLTFTNSDDVRSLLGDTYVDRYVQERMKRNIFLRGLVPDTQKGVVEKEIAESVFREVKLFSNAAFPIGNEIMIYDDKIAVFSGADKIGLIIQNKPLAESFRSIWNMAWSRESVTAEG
jgi:sugar-specific transcriptional regulator TrmB